MSYTMRVMRWRVRPPSERIRHRDALKRGQARGAVNCRPSSSSTTVCIEAWSTETRHKLSRRGPSPRRPPRPLYTMAVRSRCDFFFSLCDFLHQCNCTIMEEGLPQENYLRLVLRLRCGFCQVTLTSCTKSSTYS